MLQYLPQCIDPSLCVTEFDAYEQNDSNQDNEGFNSSESSEDLSNDDDDDLVL